MALLESTKLSNTQLELLKVFSQPMSEDDLQEFKSYIAKFFAKKLINQANEVWEKENWKEEEILNIKPRKWK